MGLLQRGRPQAPSADQRDDRDGDIAERRTRSWHATQHAVRARMQVPGAVGGMVMDRELAGSWGGLFPMGIHRKKLASKPNAQRRHPLRCAPAPARPSFTLDAAKNASAEWGKSDPGRCYHLPRHPNPHEGFVAHLVFPSPSQPARW